MCYNTLLVLEVGMRKNSNLVQGMGVNTRDDLTRVDGETTKEYFLWQRMLSRCTEKYWERFPTYVGVTCSDGFKNLDSFYKWCHEQVGFGNKDDKGRLWQIDKDLLIKGNKFYSENTCCFVPFTINAFLTKSASARGIYPIGVSVSKDGNRFIARCSDGNKNSIYLNTHDTPQKAFQAYKLCKERVAKELANKHKDQLDQRAYQALMNYRVEITD